MDVVAGSSQVARFLVSHPEVKDVQTEPTNPGVRFRGASLPRTVKVGRPELEQYGLLELMDNNPLVCAQEMSIPQLAASLCLIALGPVLLSGLVTEPPSFITNLKIEEHEISQALRTVGWHNGATTQTEEGPPSEVAFATGMAVIQSISDPEELADLYLERFGKSAFIRMTPELDWTPNLVHGRPLAIYRIAVVPDEPTSLVSVRVMCDNTGMFQAAQIVNAMNIMLGLPDDLGITL